MIPGSGAVTQPVCQTSKWDAPASAASPAARPRKMARRLLVLSLQLCPPSDIATSMNISRIFLEAHKTLHEKNAKNNESLGGYIRLA